MLVVKVEVWPGGDSGRSYEISRLGIGNRSSLAELSDYSVTALTERDTEEAVLRSFVNGHQRSHGWMPLVQRSVAALAGKATEAPYDDPIAQLLRKD